MDPKSNRIYKKKGVWGGSGRDRVVLTWRQ